MSAPLKAGDTVRCINAKSHPEWADWYMDNHYAEDMLVEGQCYLLTDIRERDGFIGYDVGVPTPWGDRYWDSKRFERSLLRLPVYLGAANQVPA